MNLPPAANMALVDFLSATSRYGELRRAVAVCHIDPPHRSVDELAATVRDAEQALLAVFSAVLGEPDVSFPDAD